jgi:hypothetical protein
MMEALAEAPCSSEDLTSKMFCTKSAVNAMLKQVREMLPGRIRVCRWLRTQGCLAPVYELGSDPDVARPARRTAKQRHYDIKANEKTRDYNRLWKLAKKRTAREQKHPGLLEKVAQFVQANGKCKTMEIVRGCDADSNVVFAILRELEDTKRLMRISGPKVTHTVWAVYIAGWQPPVIDLVQRVRQKWHAPKLPKQSIFSALGI